ncbi:hypothetical protein [Vibrio diazotrophicus]|mgnify:CR=1 FL=1|jgi:hypothetical protein|uniref:hypothetical protein n=1 Tax=Vibrio diazotrophicus TaxID=685 RepID=UPI000C9E92AB|nr:hypothetical protein [Vibrio diazotrophicus]NIY93285.1 hypothetical protein [Vibrio diazotrophicus]PNH87202.1 hypothetical protein C1M56_14990 [Vibrio diazotrophicus]
MSLNSGTYLITCDNKDCSTGYQLVTLAEVKTELAPPYMTLDQLKQVMPETVLFLAICWCWKKINHH